MAWEVVSLALVALVGLNFYIAFNISDDPKHVIFKVFFLWFGFTLIMPLFWICYYAIPSAEAAARNIFKNLFVTYLPLYLFMNYIIYFAFWKDIVLFFKDSLGGIKGEKEEKI